ncbi:KPNA5_6 [Mytilus edulis]|uniref:KPNA5_6 n=1 Tax=Mytilus edulis TaxID=6550 RepID=A0A8S3R891_MYTED|nr:KPNA5_6 [Mytilus edulis]
MCFTVDRKAQYKHKTDDVDTIRNRNRNEEIALRKEKKDKLLSSKRFRLAEGEEITDEYSISEVKTIAATLKKSGTNTLAALKLLRQAFSQGTVYIDAFISEENIIHTLVGLYTGTNSDLQLEAGWCITNISAGSHDQAMLISKYVAPYLVAYLSSQNFLLQDQSAWALGNLAGDSQECRNMVRAQGVVAPLIKLLQSQHPAVVQSAAFALSNLAKECIEISREMIQGQVISALLPHFIYHPDNVNILSEVSWVFTYLASSGEFSEEIVKNGVLTQIVVLLIQLSEVKPHIATVVTPLLRCLGNLCSGPDEYTVMACENQQLLPVLGTYLSSNHRHVKKETLWVLSNLTTIHGEEICSYLVDNGVLQQVTPVLKSSDGCHVFEECDGVTRLEALDYHNNDTIRHQASELLDVYFYGESQEGDG